MKEAFFEEGSSQKSFHGTDVILLYVKCQLLLQEAVWGGEERDSDARVHISATPLINNITLDKLLNLSVPLE